MNNRDLELLSAYLDGRLPPAESAYLESRLKSDPQMVSALADLRAMQGIFRKLPQRKAPRNFTLTRKMVGLNPPLPRSYSFFRLATAFASLALVMTFATNALSPHLGYVGPIPMGYGMGGGGYGGIGGGVELESAAPEEQSLDAPAAEAPAMELAPQPAGTVSPEDAARIAPTAEAPMAKSDGENQPVPQSQSQPPVEESAPIPVGWQVAFLAAAAFGATVMFVQRESAKRRWR